MWDGDIHGKNTEVIPNKKLVQEWFGGDWEKPSITTFSLSNKDGVTTIDFLHENVPDSDARSIEDGWKDYYLGPLKNYAEENK